MQKKQILKIGGGVPLIQLAKELANQVNSKDERMITFQMKSGNDLIVIIQLTIALLHIKNSINQKKIVFFAY